MPWLLHVAVCAERFTSWIIHYKADEALCFPLRYKYNGRTLRHLGILVLTPPASILLNISKLLKNLAPSLRK